MTSNSLTKKNTDKYIEYDCGGEKVKLSPTIIKNYLVSGNGNVSDQEVVMFLNLCRFQHLNPFLREAYLIKFGGQPATMVVGKEAFTKRARANKDFRGFDAGVIVLQENGDITNRTGTFYLPTDKLVGGWAKVYIDKYQAPIEVTVSLQEYIGKKSTGEVNVQWSKKPATMIRKIALVQALREAFPENLSGMYSQEEMSDLDINLDTTPAFVPETATEEKPTESIQFDEYEPADPLE